MTKFHAEFPYLVQNLETCECCETWNCECQ